MRVLYFFQMVLYLAGEGASSAPVHVVSLTKESPFFQMPSIPRDGAEYIVRLECSLSATTYDYTAPAAGFFAVGPHKHVTFRFEPVVRIMTSFESVKFLKTRLEQGKFGS